MHSLIFGYCELKLLPESDGANRVNNPSIFRNPRSVSYGGNGR